MNKEVKIGKKMYEAGDFMDETKEITVTPENIGIIKMFLGKCYFFNYDSAEERAFINRGNYADYYTERR